MLTSSEEIKHKLSELASLQPGQIEGGHIEIYWQDQNENESSTDEPVPGIAKDALDRIRSLESGVIQAIGWAESTGSLRPEDCGETLRLLKDLVNYQPSLLEHGEADSELMGLFESIEFPCSDEEFDGAKQRLAELNKLTVQEHSSSLPIFWVSPDVGVWLEEQYFNDNVFHELNAVQNMPFAVLELLRNELRQYRNKLRGGLFEPAFSEPWVTNFVVCYFAPSCKNPAVEDDAEIMLGSSATQAVKDRVMQELKLFYQYLERYIDQPSENGKIQYSDDFSKLIWVRNE